MERDRRSGQSGNLSADDAFSLHGQSKDALAKTKLGAWEYDVVAPYFKCNMTDIMAAIGLVQLERYPDILARRRELIEKYDRAFSGLPVTYLKHLEMIFLPAAICI